MTAVKKKISRMLTESQIQQAYFNHIREMGEHDDRYKLIHHIPNGNTGFATALQRMRLKKMGCLSGVPDIFIPMPSMGFHGFYIELKSKTGQLNKAQKEFREAIRDLGYKWEMARTTEDALNMTYDYMEGSNLEQSLNGAKVKRERRNVC